MEQSDKLENIWVDDPYKINNKLVTQDFLLEILKDIRKSLFCANTMVIMQGKDKTSPLVGDIINNLFEAQNTIINNFNLDFNNLTKIKQSNKS